ncbi:MAG TPA: hypothetical protein IGS52_09065 [Oscillatoriaceae cyanobacterium M33_DOE_052]|uniref:Uncharacterized protein n=1 Tax=Planktothricoides sp. SpSt-374 TaxID=2282167 RepID=A0A7C3VQ13_9CYAN|nr:hypothetical protein [Oscillatoriaceae cyanobacterium M33_DOE_052]
MLFELNSMQAIDLWGRVQKPGFCEGKGRSPPARCANGFLGGGVQKPGFCYYLGSEAQVVQH